MTNPNRTITKVILLLGCLAQSAYSNQIWQWNGSFGGYALTGMVDFSVIQNGAQWALQIDITNNATVIPPTTADILTGIYFDVTATGQGALGVKSAVATGGLLDTTHQAPGTQFNVGTNICAPGKGGTALNNSCAATIGGGWEAAYNPSGIGGGQTAKQKYGVGTSGQGGVFSGNSANAGNANYGVAPTAGINVGLDGIGGMVPYSYQTVTIVLYGLITPNVTISNVAAAYGTAPEATPAGLIDINGPEPGTWLMMGGGIAAIAWRRRRRAPGPEGSCRRES